MEKEKNIVVSGGFSASKLLGVAFVVLKLLNEISWSWVWVLAPFWIPYALLFSVLIILFLICAILSMFNNGY